MRLMLLVFAVFLLSAGTSARADGPTVRVDWSFGQGTNRHAAVITIKNLSGQELKVQYPGNRQAITFVVMDDQGNVIKPEGVAKVDPMRQDIVLKPGGTCEYTDSQWAKLAKARGLTLPFLTGTGLFAHKLAEGSTYRVTVIYRPSADSEGIASTEKVVMFKADDPGSPSQEVRDAAAKILRSSYTAPSRTNWEAVVNSITNSMTKTNLLELLSPYHVTPEMGMGSGDSHSQTYRLDDAWILVCWFRNQGDILFERTLSPSLRYVWVAPPTNFSGIWITYFVNGQKSHEIHYDHGKYQGEFIAYRPDGSKCYVQHYDHHVGEGADTGYFSSGRTNYHGVYKAGKQVGIWTWYNEDGSVKSSNNYSK